MTERPLALEIRQLESDRQALVYNHHHELIAASDTIRAVSAGDDDDEPASGTLIDLTLSVNKMKTRADSLDVDLEKLKAAFSEISRLSSEVTDEPNASKT